MSGFVIKYTDMYNMLWENKSRLEGLIENIEACENSIIRFIESESFQGKGAEAIKNYLNEVHITMLSSLKVTARSLLDNMVLYKAGYYEIDNSTNFVLSEEAIREFRKKLAGGYSDTGDYNEEISRAVYGISDISEVKRPDSSRVLAIHEQMDRELSDLIDDIEAQESLTVKALENSVGLLLENLETCIGKIRTGKTDISSYKSGSFYADRDVCTLAGLSQIFYQQHEENREAYNRIWETEQELRDAAEAREVEGIWETVEGAALIVTGVLCIAATGGAAAPVVAACKVCGGSTIKGIFFQQ